MARPPIETERMTQEKIQPSRHPLFATAGDNSTLRTETPPLRHHPPNTKNSSPSGVSPKAGRRSADSHPFGHNGRKRGRELGSRKHHSSGLRMEAHTVPPDSHCVVTI